MRVNQYHITYIILDRTWNVIRVKIKNNMEFGTLCAHESLTGPREPYHDRERIENPNRCNLRSSTPHSRYGNCTQ